MNVKEVVAGIIITLSLLSFPGQGQQQNVGEQAVAQSTLVINTITPKPGTQLIKKTAIVASLSYKIAEFDDGDDYSIMAQFETKKGKYTTDGKFPYADYPSLNQSTGELNFSFPMKYVWQQKDVKHPFVMWFYLVKWTNVTSNKKSGKKIASAGPIEFQVK